VVAELRVDLAREGAAPSFRAAVFGSHGDAPCKRGRVEEEWWRGARVRGTLRVAQKKEIVLEE
jgi:hypothetical protein